MIEHTATDGDAPETSDPRAAQLLDTWRQLDERYQQVVIATAGALAAFVKFRKVDAETRRLAMRLLEDPSDTELRALHEHPAGTAISQWLLSLPSYLDNEDGLDATARQGGADAEREVTSEHTPDTARVTSVDLRGDVSRLFQHAAPGS
jgi:hypothetical protein